MLVELLILSRRTFSRERLKHVISSFKPQETTVAWDNGQDRPWQGREEEEMRVWVPNLWALPRLGDVGTTSVMALPKGCGLSGTGGSSRAPGNQECTQRWPHLHREKWIYREANRASLSGTLSYPDCFFPTSQGALWVEFETVPQSCKGQGKPEEKGRPLQIGRWHLS